MRNTTDADSRFHALSHILVQSISRAFHESESLEGFFIFTEKLLSVKERYQQKSDSSNNQVLSAKAKAVLNESGLYDSVIAKINYYLNHQK